jgi:tetratricopeptide (TPR) repeat protein
MNMEDPNTPDKKHNLGSVDQYIDAATAAVTAGNFDEAIEITRESTTRWPDDPRTHFNLASAIFSKLQADRAHLELWEDLADEEELAEECFDALQTAIAKGPQMTEAYKNLGTLLALRGRADKAIQMWKKALELDPNQPELKEQLTILEDKVKRNE